MGNFHILNQCRKEANQTYNDSEMMNSQIDSKPIEDDAIQIQSRSMSDPTLSDIDFKNKTVWTTLKILMTDFSQVTNKIIQPRRIYH